MRPRQPQPVPARRGRHRRRPAAGGRRRRGGDRRVTGSLEVPGARIHHRLRGSGPLVLLLPGGDGDADSSDGIASRLEQTHTVLTYDRRGLSRSTVEDRTRAPGIATHADDAHRLLDALAAEPAFVFGTSIGAVIALELIARHPGQVRHLVAFEPPLTELLPESARAAAERAQLEVEEIFRTVGAPDAMMRFATMIGIDVEDREPGVLLPRMTPERLPNLEYFLAHDAPAVRSYRADLPALRAVAAQITPAAGRSSNSVVGPEVAARELAALLDRELAEFSGGHQAPALRPGELATGLAEIFAAMRAPPRALHTLRGAQVRRRRRTPLAAPARRGGGSAPARSRRCA